MEQIQQRFCFSYFIQRSQRVRLYIYKSGHAVRSWHWHVPLYQQGTANVRNESVHLAFASHAASRTAEFA